MTGGMGLCLSSGRLASTAASATAATAAAGSASSRAAALRAHQRVVLRVRGRSALLEAGGHTGHDLGALGHLGRVDDFRERTVADAEPQAEHLQLLVLVLPRGAARFLNLN